MVPNPEIIFGKSGVIYGIKYRLTAWIKVNNIKNARLLATAESSDYQSAIYLYHDYISECADGTCNDKWYQLTINW